MDRQQQIDKVVDRFLELRDAGEPISLDQVRGEHEALLPELDEALRRVTLLDGAWSASEEPGVETLAMDAGQSTATEIRCPHCHVATPMPVAPTDVECSHCGKPFSICDELSHLPPRSILGRFELQECVGIGSFGAVWRAHDRELNRSVAVKVPRHGQLGGRSVDSFLQEARVAAQLQHPYIVRVHEVGRHDADVYIVSAYIDGQPLDDWLDAEPIGINEACSLVRKLAVALQHAHDRGIVHRDLKPQNILMDQHREPHITDFGLAKCALDDTTITLDGRILGTPAYMSPEQASGQSAAADARSDVYSLGVILFELLTSSLPFRGKSMMLIQQVIHDDPPSPRRLNSEIPRDLETVCLKCLEKDPERRYATARELEEELARIQSGTPILARPIGSVGHLWRWCCRNQWLAGMSVTAALLLFGLLAAGWGFFFDERHDRQEILAALEQENFIRQAYLQTEDFRAFRDWLEAIAVDSEFLQLVQAASWKTVHARRALNSQTTDTAPWLVAQSELLSDAARIRLQDRLEELRHTSSLPMFAAFVLTSDGVQIARSPTDRAFGRNYAWRTYFHGGSRDYRNRAQYLAGAPTERRHIQTTYLSRGLFTEVTHRHVVVISTPLRHNNQFHGILGLMVKLNISQEEGKTSQLDEPQ